MNKLLYVMRLITTRILIISRPFFWDRSIIIPITTIIQKSIKFEKKGCHIIKIGRKSRITGTGMMRASNGKIDIGEHCEIRDSNIQANKGEIVIGDNTFLNSGCILVACERIQIGNNCAFGTNVSIYDQDHVYTPKGMQNWNITRTKPIIIGDNCWIGCNVVILKGSVIGNNCVIGAGTVVKGDIPDSTVAYQNRSLVLKKIKESNNV